MANWEEIAETYRQVASSPRFVLLVRGMMSIVDKLRENLDAEDTDVRVAISADFALLLRTAESSRSVHIEWIEPETYEVFLDYCGSTPETFYGERVRVTTDEVTITIREYLQRLSDDNLR